MMLNAKGKKNARVVRACIHCEYKFDASKMKCPSCGKWDTPQIQDNNQDQTILLSDISEKPLNYIETGPWDKCFSKMGGIVTTSVTLVGGAPGAGKSTMSLQLSDRIIENTKREVLFIGTEQAVEEVKHHAQRLRLKNMNRMRLYPMGANSDIGVILMNRRPSAIVVDSLPGLTSDHDQAVQVCKRFKEYAVELQSPVIVIDHITKDGDLAGLMALQHEVDTLLLFEIDKENKVFRTLSGQKNRFGPCERVLLEMTEHGLILGLEDEDEEDDEDE